jgi:glutamate---cysteine ligase / carboxylate-amine ligase
MEIPFNSSPCASLGIEVELGIVDRRSRELSSAAGVLISELAHEAAAHASPKAKHELFECTVEIITDVCATVGEARRDLDTTLTALAEIAARHDLALTCSGTHPFSHWSAQQISPDPRYADLVDRIQWPARRLAIHGVHFHVGVRSGEKAVAITNSLAFHLPFLLALSASSPYWHGIDTGMASCRTKVFEGLPTAGLPPRLGGWADFERFMETLITAGTIETVREVWWDVRPHPTFGTVELRMCDAMATFDEIAAVAALAQCLVHDLDQRLDAGEALPGARDWVIRENKWLAARFGLEARLIVDNRGGLRPARDAIADLLTSLAPRGRELGCADELDSIRRILDVGPGYERQRRVISQGGTMVDVVDLLIAELRAGAPLP